MLAFRQSLEEVMDVGFTHDELLVAMDVIGGWEGGLRHDDVSVFTPTLPAIGGSLP